MGGRSMASISKIEPRRQFTSAPSLKRLGAFVFWCSSQKNGGRTDDCSRPVPVMMAFAKRNERINDDVLWLLRFIRSNRWTTVGRRRSEIYWSDGAAALRAIVGWPAVRLLRRNVRQINRRRRSRNLYSARGCSEPSSFFKKIDSPSDGSHG